MVLFFQKKPPQRFQPGAPPQEYIPTDIVQKMASQGMPEPEIISQLRSQGFSPMQIDRALSQAIKSAVSLPQKQPQQYPSQFQLPQQPARGAPPERIVPGPQVRSATEPLSFQQAPPFDFSPQSQNMSNEFTFEETPQEFVESPQIPQPPEGGPEITLEEVIEGIVADRWASFEERLNGFDQRDQQLEQKIEDLRKQADEVRGLVGKSEQTFVGKLEEFGGHIGGIESRIGSIEKAFRDFLPELTENVRTMADIVDRLKKDEKKK